MKRIMNLLLTFSIAGLVLACSGSNSAASMAPRVEVASKKECELEGMTAPERAMCKDRVENCYPGRNSQSLVCKRRLSDLSQVVKPAELVELDGRLVRDGDNIYLAASGQNENAPAVKVLGESCLKIEVRRLCDLPSNSIVTLIGAYYSVEANPASKMHVVGNLLALDMFEGGRQTPPPAC